MRKHVEHASADDVVRSASERALDDDREVDVRADIERDAVGATERSDRLDHIAHGGHGGDRV